MLFHIGPAVMPVRHRINIMALLFSRHVYGNKRYLEMSFLRKFADTSEENEVVKLANSQSVF